MSVKQAKALLGVSAQAAQTRTLRIAPTGLLMDLTLHSL
jgi:hypothetical protein